MENRADSGGERAGGDRHVSGRKGSVGGEFGRWKGVDDRYGVKAGDGDAGFSYEAIEPAEIHARRENSADFGPGSRGFGGGGCSDGEGSEANSSGEKCGRNFGAAGWVESVRSGDAGK